MAKEIERKFLVAGGEWRDEVTHSMAFRQAYVASLENRSVRVRIVNGRDATLTIKIGASALVRDEYEYSIPLQDAEELMASAPGVVIEKTRHTVDHGGFTWEIDVFEGRYQGLVVAEVEMNDENASPDLPPWLGKEVTGDRRFSNQSLAMDCSSGGLPDALQD
ncbi:CYTH domain-containing protein [Agrobacterium genomosp. 3]|uniref:CYTH domain-containing protein n=1 Tax=Rhizobium/Agrobacterium group TaxID=227290 RepID=UPI00062A31A8|nr:MULTISPECIES: CYTH domain-containing protein [Rhizobium/Agrobacterium group]MCA1865331.1 CYTH domain-containing protein [Agrobacterium tomkonis]MCA1875454.1 CYTH domain-containing protein [Agrobacterium tumefaciens]KRA69312.1 adenylate cyclase [Rhizobium sp. Root651]MCA1891598.1 CYTH domain-containing protein [Agrobacterium tomkonis]TKT56664.1 CYTH domain-containing protein [Agrobacterium sp. LC34]